MVRSKTKSRGGAIATKPLQDYIGRLAGIPSVEKVLLSEHEEGLTVWTIIDAPPFEDSVRAPIYEAELEALRGCPEETMIDLHVLNLSEYAGEGGISAAIPSDARVIWHR